MTMLFTARAQGRVTAAAFVMVGLLNLGSGSAASAQALAGSGFPGDHGRPGNGLPMPPDAPPPPPRPPEDVAASLPIDLAVDLARGVVTACKGFAIGVSVIDASGKPKLYYIGDGASGGHAYTGFRKAYTALSFAAPTSKVGAMALADAAVAARVAADPNLMTWAGGLPIIDHGKLIGAVGVSGAEPSEVDEACAQKALDRVRPRLP